MADIWSMFIKDTIEILENERRVQCVLCGDMITYTVMSDLKQHLIKLHSNYVIRLELDTTKPRALVSYIWKHFKQTDCKFHAECNYCMKSFSYKTTVANLKKHLSRAHPDIDAEKGVIKIDKNSEETNPSTDDLPEAVNNVIDEVSAVTSKPVNVSRNDEERIEDHNKHESNFKKDTEDKYTEPPREAAQASENVWHYFDKIPSNKARCILCKETFNRYTPFLMKHMSERHRNITLDIPTDSDDDQGCYTDVVYLEDHQPVEPTPIKPNPTKRKPEPTRPPRQPSPTYNYVKKVKENEPVEEEVDEDIGNFARYVIGLLKKLPKDICMQLQMDIINMVMTAKLNTYTMAMNEALNANMNTIQDGVILSSSNAIVTTPSNVIHAGQTRDNLPSLVIGIDRGMYS